MGGDLPPVTISQVLLAAMPEQNHTVFLWTLLHRQNRLLIIFLVTSLVLCVWFVGVIIEKCSSRRTLFITDGNTGQGKLD